MPGLLKFAILIPLFAACASKQFYNESMARYNSSEGKSLKTFVVWTKNKPTSVDMTVRFVNEYKHTVLIKDFSLETSGLKIGPPEPIILEFQPGQTQEKLLIFKATSKQYTGDKKGKLSFSIFDQLNRPLPGYSQEYELCPVESIVDCPH